MALKRVKQEIDKVDLLLGKLNDRIQKLEDEEITSHWAKYACICCSGAVEECLREILAPFAKKRKDLSIKRRTLGVSNLDRILEKLEMLESKSEWKDSIVGYLDDKKRESINSIFRNRHALAHGNDNVDLTINRLAEWWEDMIEFLAAIYIVTLGKDLHKNSLGRDSFV